MKRRFTDDSFRREPWFRALCRALLSCRTEEETADFLRDIGTLSELQAWSERLEVAKQLAQGITYRQIAINTGASTTTVTRVAKFLENGEGGYRTFLRAHRHHRLVSRAEDQNAHVHIDTRMLVPDAQHRKEGDREPRSPISVLQKYLERRRP